MKEVPKSVPGRLLEKLSQRRKPIPQPKQESPEEKEPPAKAAAEKHASELVEQEEREKKKLKEKEAKINQAALSNTERARQAAEKLRKERAEAKADEPPTRATIRRTKKIADKGDGDPPEDDQTPWKIYTYRPP